MLTTLRIENFAIIAELELDFTEGMTAFTGETGAGKSIMIDALMLAIGGRADTTVVRSGAEKCEIHASFTFDTNAPPAHWLAAHDIDNHENEIILRRVIYAEGRSKSYINGQPYPLNKIKELSELLVEIHGQHQHQSLLHHNTHREQLDQYATHQNLCDDVKHLYQTCNNLKHTIAELTMVTPTRERVQWLQEKLEELEQLHIRDGEIHALHKEHQDLHHANDYLECVQQITHLLTNEDTPNICRNLHQGLQKLATLPAENTQIKNLNDLFNNALIQCEEAVHELETFASVVQLNPTRLGIVEERMNTLHQTARRYHVDVNNLHALCGTLQQELDQLLHTDEKIKQLQEQYKQSCIAYDKAALTLRASRTQQATKLAAEITHTIQQLAMPNGYIQLAITPLEYMHNHGLDKVEYIVATNPGLPADGLAKIASGGELSRISLAIQMVTAQRASTPTLLFDEVDVGIGGSTAALVGKLLRTLGERLQVFCVTHQPQVACSAHNHFMVQKNIVDEKTYLQVNRLQHTQKIDEIARMMAGLTITEQTRSHAAELIKEAISLDFEQTAI